MIRQLAGQFAIKTLCRTLGVSRSGYYAAQKKAERPRAKDNARLSGKLVELFEASRRTYGSPRLTVALRRAGERCGRHRVARLMRGRGAARGAKAALFGPAPPTAAISAPWRPITWLHGRRLHTPVGCGRRTSRMSPPKRVGSTWLACSMRLVGASLAGPLALPCPRTWSPALWSGPSSSAGRRPDGFTIRKRGSPYASEAYGGWLRRHGAIASMSRAACCYDNAAMESFWATLKSELIQDRVFDSHAQAHTEIFDYIEVCYNRRRLHSALGYRAPVDFENQLS